MLACSIFDYEVARSYEVTTKWVPLSPYLNELWHGQFLSYSTKNLTGASLVYK